MLKPLHTLHFAALSQWYVFPRVMCAPEHISLVICVSLPGKHKTLKLCIQAFEWHNNIKNKMAIGCVEIPAGFSSSRRANSQILLQRSRRMNYVFMLRFGCSRDSLFATSSRSRGLRSRLVTITVSWGGKHISLKGLRQWSVFPLIRILFNDIH